MKRNSEPTVGQRLLSQQAAPQVVLATDARPLFEEGAQLVFSRWTALELAVQNEWGGPSSEDKANQLYSDVIDWFYDTKEHYADDLAIDLQQIMLQDFNAEIEDGSPEQVAAELIKLHTQLAQGNTAELERLRAVVPETASISWAIQEQAEDGSSDNEEAGSEEDVNMETDEMPAAVPLSSSKPKAPVVDDEGFQLVQRR